jgi:hypothetical protein
MCQGVKINELMYGPKNGEPEWLELYNGSSHGVNIKGWEIKNKNARSYLLTGTDFNVAPDSYLVITKSDTLFTFHHTIPSRVLICPALPAAFMVNTGDTISIRDLTGSLIDSVFYQSSWGGSNGKSLERRSVDGSPFVSTNWGTSLDSSGSTPGRKNSITGKDYDLKITDFSAALSVSDRISTFGVTVKNCGLRSSSPFDIYVFLDCNNDFTSQPNELAVKSSNLSGLYPEDSASFVLRATPANFQARNAMAVVEYLSDQDTTNNALWAKIKYSYTEKCLVVNEMMYAPKSPEPEWVELFNASTDSVNLRGFTLSDNSGARVEISTGDRVLAPSDFVVVAHDSGFLSIHPSAAIKTLIAKIPSLNNTGDVVAIHDELGNLIDSVNYSPSWGGNTGGKSLERILPDGDSNDQRNFETSSDSSGSTPGRINSVTPRDFDLAVGTIECSPLMVQSGGNVVVSAAVVNRGLTPAGPVSVIFFNDRNANGVCDARECVDSIQIPQILPGDSAIVRFPSDNLCFGIYHFGIFIDFHADELLSNNTRTVPVTVGLPRSSVVINEVMYAPKAPQQEWIELCNTSNAAIDLSGFKLETHGGSAKIVAGSIIAPNDFAVICKDSSVSHIHYPVKNLIVESTPSLSNSGDWIVIYDNLGNSLDSISYVPSYGGSDGKSLERIDYLAGDDSTNWSESVDSTGATPGLINSVAILPFDISLVRLDCPKMLDVNQEGEINLVIRNCGRNALGSIDARLEILNGITGRLVFSDERDISTTLQPRDSMPADFSFAPSQPGTYRIRATVSQHYDQRQRNDTLSTSLSVRYQPRSLVVNEIMYNGAKMGEYFEIYNMSPDAIDLNDWTFHTSSNQLSPHVISTYRRVLPLGGYFVVAADSLICGSIPDTNNVQIVRSLSLRDDGGCIVLADPTGVIIDSVYYLPSWHNSDVANASTRSLEKINPALASNDKTSWSTCVSQAGGTPGEKNSLFVNAGNAAGSISVSPNPFSPDGDGVDDFTFISYSFPVPYVKVRVRIFDSIGRLVATPEDNAVLQSNGKVVWDGRNGSGEVVRFGLYILLVEVTGPDGKSLSTLKKPIVVAKKMR